MSASHDSEAANVPSYQACSSCRSQKLRCIPDGSKPNVCQRCARLGRDCVFGALPKRKQRKRTDARVAELEQEMRAMRALLNNQAEAQLPLSEIQSDETPGMAYLSAVGQVYGYASQGSSAPSATLQPGLIPSISRPLNVIGKVSTDNWKDVIDRDLLSMATARQLFETYRRDLFPHYPIVHVSPSISAEEMRQSKPTLFLAIVAAAAGKDCPELSATLDQEVLQTYAIKSLVQSEKSLELVQALLLSAIWYHPPSKFAQLKYYEYIHMAATMAMDIGIGTRPLPHRNNFPVPPRVFIRGAAEVHHLEDASNPDLSMTPRSILSSPDTASIESRRTFIACFSICTGVSLSVRRPNMLRATSYLKQCLEYIEHSPEAIPSDRTLVAWVRLMMIANEINDCLQYDDPGNMASIADLRTQFVLRDMARRLDAWRTNVSPEDMTGSLTITYWTTRLYLHEVALHVDHSPEDFKAPYQMGTVHLWAGEDIPTHVFADTIAECITCAHNLINTFLGIDVSSARALPVLTYVRVSFAAFVLAKLCLSASHPGSEIGRVLDRASLRATTVLDSAILHVRAIIGPTKCRVPTIFLALLFKLRQWCLDPTLIEYPDLDIRASVAGSGGPQRPAVEGTRSDELNRDQHRTANSTPRKAAMLDIRDTVGSSSGTDTAMELDQSLFDFLQDMDAFDTEKAIQLDGLTSIPTDMFGLPDDSNWLRPQANPE